MPRRYSIAEARQNLAAIVHDLEHKPRLELTRRGEPVAVLLSMREYQRLTEPPLDFWGAYETFRQTVNLSELAIDPDEVFKGARDAVTGREVYL